MKRFLLGILTTSVVLGLAAGPAPAGTINGKVTCEGRKDNRDAVVYVEEVQGTSPASKEPVKIDQVKMKFVPHVTPVVIGTQIDFHNSDNVLHNVFTPSKAGDRFNLGSWPQGQIRSYTVKKLGSIRLLCNVHPEMLGWIVVLSNPHFAKTGPDGAYSIPDVPAGTYTVKVWHEKLKPASQNITVPASGDVKADFTVSR